jgi:hypothetical protein
VIDSRHAYELRIIVLARGLACYVAVEGGGILQVQCAL